MEAGERNVQPPRRRFWFCPKCGGSLDYRQAGERCRLVCGRCSYIMYENPIVGVAAIVLEGGRILLGRRAAGATYPGLWCIPCGYVEYDEDVRAAIVREFREETGLIIEPEEVFTVLSNWHNPEVHTVGVWFSARVAGGAVQPGDDIDAVDYFPLTALPPLAFPTDARVIKMLAGQAQNCKSAKPVL
ncbi:MAG: NUDIX hydrolase [Negativicutes bacterium]|nr:NUDIX hydrolase [Negativicutes bacterium]